MFGFRFTLHLSQGQGQAGVEQKRKREGVVERQRERGKRGRERVRKTAAVAAVYVTCGRSDSTQLDNAMRCAAAKRDTSPRWQVSGSACEGRGSTGNAGTEVIQRQQTTTTTRRRGSSSNNNLSYKTMRRGRQSMEFICDARAALQKLNLNPKNTLHNTLYVCVCLCACAWCLPVCVCACT